MTFPSSPQWRLDACFVPPNLKKINASINRVTDFHLLSISAEPSYAVPNPPSSVGGSVSDLKVSQIPQRGPCSCSFPGRLQLQGHHDAKIGDEARGGEPKIGGWVSVCWTYISVAYPWVTKWLCQELKMNNTPSVFKGNDDLTLILLWTALALVPLESPITITKNAQTVSNSILCFLVNIIASYWVLPLPLVSAP